MTAKVIDLCMCNFADKIPACKERVTMLGLKVGKDPYCKNCGKLLSQKDVDTFGYELGLRE